MKVNQITVFRGLALALSLLCALLALGGLVWLALRNTQTPPANQARVAQRLKTLADLRLASDEVLLSYEWVNKEKGVLRIPVARAKELMLQEWKDPAAARSNLMTRAAVALAVPQPEPSPYE